MSEKAVTDEREHIDRESMLIVRKKESVSSRESTENVYFSPCVVALKGFSTSMFIFGDVFSRDLRPLNLWIQSCKALSFICSFSNELPYQGDFDKNLETESSSNLKIDIDVVAVNPFIDAKYMLWVDMDKFKTWLDEKKAEQNKLSKTRTMTQLS
ncbi:hypothetical protein DITRI_Ditri07aG0039800 [Diplodiscus trichospermus]